MSYAFKQFSLDKIPLTNSYLVNGNEFPVAFKICGNSDANDLSEYVQYLAQSNEFNRLQEAHGAVVINLKTNDPKTLSKYVRIIQEESGKRPFVQSGVQAKRTEIAEYLQTANEGDPSRKIYQHNEFSRFKSYPNNLAFVNTKMTVPKGNGGETPIVHCGELYNRLEKEYPDFISELNAKGLFLTQDWPYERNDQGFTWVDKYSFGRNIDHESDDIDVQKAKAEEVLKADVSEDFEWLESNDLRVYQHTRPVRQYVNGKYNVLFSSLPTYYQQMKARGDGKITIKYDNGDLIPTKYLDKVLELSEELQYLHQWTEGDLVFVDNRQVSHGRIGWKGGERIVLVSMWDDEHKLKPLDQPKP